MTRKVSENYNKVAKLNYRGYIAQFIIFLVLRSLDIATSIAVLVNAWSNNDDWKNIDSTYTNKSIGEGRVELFNQPKKVCQDLKDWKEHGIDASISNYKLILYFTVIFNVTSVIIFLTRLAFWSQTLRKISQDEKEKHHTDDNIVTRLTQNSKIALLTPIVRAVPLSCLNTELLALRSGHNGLVCMACILGERCLFKQQYIENTINAAKHILYAYYIVVFVNSQWKGVSAFYRLVRFEKLNLHMIRACASMVFAFLYSITIFTPAMFIFIYRYKATAGFELIFLNDLFNRLIVLGATIWAVCMSAVICCPILYAIQVSA